MRLAPAAAAALALVVGLAAPATAQETAAETGFTEEVSVGYVLVPLTVRSRAGFVTDLEWDEITLEVDGRPIAFDALERATESPISIAYLQDLSGSMALGGKLDHSRAFLDCLLDQARRGDRFALAAFAGRSLDVEVPFSDERRPIDEAADAWRAYGVTALHDAVARLPEIAASRRNPNVVAVLVTDGAENASTLTPEQSRDVVRWARIPVYVLGFTSRAGYEDEADRYSGVLRRLAAYTGGRYFALRESGEASRACVEISIEARSRYVLGFPASDRGDVRPRTIRVRVERRGVEIGHRLGYTGRPPVWDN